MAVVSAVTPARAVRLIAQILAGALAYDFLYLPRGGTEAVHDPEAEATMPRKHVT